MPRLIIFVIVFALVCMLSWVSQVSLGQQSPIPITQGAAQAPSPTPVGISTANSDANAQSAEGATPASGCGSVTLGKIEGDIPPEQQQQIVTQPAEMPEAVPDTQIENVPPGEGTGIGGAQGEGQPQVGGPQEDGTCDYSPQGEILCNIGGQIYKGCQMLPDNSVDCSNAVPLQ